MSDQRSDPFDLEALFEAEKGNSLEPSDDFLTRVMADAKQVQTGFATAQATPIVSVGFWATLSAALGGWPTFAGLATATVAGVWIGVSPPQGLDSLTDSVLGNSLDYSDYLPGFDSVLTEG